MSTLIIGDLHGRVEIARKALDMRMPTVFVGDYVDSFGRSVKDQLATLTLVLDAIESRDDVVGLWGNHELGYTGVAPMCSGYSAAMAAHVIPLLRRMRKLLSNYTVVEGTWLVTHAGVSYSWLPDEIPHSLEGVAEYLDTCPDQHLHTVGRARGGFAHCGGPFWCDWHDEFIPTPNVRQIFGHSHNLPPAHERIASAKNVCIDWLDSSTDVLCATDSWLEIVSL